MRPLLLVVLACCSLWVRGYPQFNLRVIAPVSLRFVGRIFLLLLGTNLIVGMDYRVCGIRSIFGIPILTLFFRCSGRSSMVMSWFKGGFLLIVMYPWICVRVRVRLGLWMCEFHRKALWWWLRCWWMRVLVPLILYQVMLHMVPLWLGHATADPLTFFLDDLRFGGTLWLWCC